MAIEKTLKKWLLLLVSLGFLLALPGCFTKPLVDLGGARATAIESPETERIKKRLGKIERRLERVEKHLERLERD